MDQQLPIHSKYPLKSPIAAFFTAKRRLSAFRRSRADISTRRAIERVNPGIESDGMIKAGDKVIKAVRSLSLKFQSTDSP